MASKLFTFTLHSHSYPLQNPPSCTPGTRTGLCAAKGRTVSPAEGRDALQQFSTARHLPARGGRSMTTPPRWLNASAHQQLQTQSRQTAGRAECIRWSRLLCCVAVASRVVL